MPWIQIKINQCVTHKNKKYIDSSKIDCSFRLRLKAMFLNAAQNRIDLPFTILYIEDFEFPLHKDTIVYHQCHNLINIDVLQYTCVF